MKTLFETAGIMVLAWALTALSATAQSNETLEKFRTAFEERLNGELDEQGDKARKLRKGYLDALNRLKSDLGREENLKAAALVVVELEAVEDGEESKPLPEDADYRLKRLRKTWEDGLEEILADRNRMIRTTADLYFKALDAEKRKLTRAGKIKEALLFEQEENRVRELPEVAGALNAAPGGDDQGDLALASRGATVKGAEDGHYLIDGKAAGYERGRYAWALLPATMEVTLKESFEIEQIRFLLWDKDDRQYRYQLLVSEDGASWDTVKDSSGEGASSWQDVRFAARPVRYIRILGLGNTVNNGRFHVVELEAYGPGR